MQSYYSMDLAEKQVLRKIILLPFFDWLLIILSNTPSVSLLQKSLSWPYPLTSSLFQDLLLCSGSILYFTF